MLLPFRCFDLLSYWKVPCFSCLPPQHPLPLSNLSNSRLIFVSQALILGSVTLFAKGPLMPQCDAAHWVEGESSELCPKHLKEDTSWSALSRGVSPHHYSKYPTSLTVIITDSLRWLLKLALHTLYTLYSHWLPFPTRRKPKLLRAVYKTHHTRNYSPLELWPSCYRL